MDINKVKSINTNELEQRLDMALYTWVLALKDTEDVVRFSGGEVVQYADWNEVVEDCKGLGHVEIVTEYQWVTRQRSLIDYNNYQEWLETVKINYQY